MNFNLLALLLLFSLSSQAETFKLRIDQNSLNTNQVQKMENTFTHFSVNGFEMDKTIGAPELPVKSWLVQGTPAQIKVKLNVNNSEIFANTKPFPAQEPECRCAADLVKTFSYSTALFEEPLPQVEVSYLGAFRGSPVSRVDVRLAAYNASLNHVEMMTNVDVSISEPIFKVPRIDDLKDYLIVVPANLVDGVTAFADWKRSQGYNVSVEAVSSPANDLNSIQSLIRRHYDAGADFVILVGNETTLPMFRVSTSGSSQTPSDLKYFTMDGASDYIPDVFSSRIAATTVEQVSAQLAKSIEFESKTFADASGLNRFVGIASNEGSNPSDNEYILSIGNKFKEVLNSEVVHIYQNDSEKSNPTFLNNTLNSGAAWLTYMGHGDGRSWPNVRVPYSVSHIRQLANVSVVKPIIIDIACQNGRLVDGHFGTTWAAVNNTNGGAVAYYGGSVNISWHPPAIMARGIAYEHLSRNFRHLGQALMAGQLYLAANSNSQSQIIDNWEWFHLQGDPGLIISY